MTDTLHRDPKTQSLLLDGVPVATLAKKFGTPLYIYSHARLVENFSAIRDAFAPVKPLVAYAMKCNSNGAILRTVIKEGAGLDIVSGGELERGLRAGVDPKKVIFSGVGKTKEEIAAALKAGIRAFNIESEPEAFAIDAVAAKMKKKAPIAIRVNPDVDAATHHYITTGKKENKFGIPFHAVRKLAKTLAGLKHVQLIGLHAHIGSQITQPAPYLASLGRVKELLALLRKDKHEITLLNLGGGFGISYDENEKPMDMAKLAAGLIPGLQGLDVDIIFEPGRSIAGPAGFLLTKVEYIKDGDAKNFAIIDGAMNDLIRPSLYSAFHRILLDGPKRRGKARKFDIVGPICESGDFLGKDREFAGLQAGDLFVVCEAGAYGMAMASNYNSRGRAAEVLVKGGKAHLIRERETLDDQVKQEVVPGFLK